MAGRTNLVLTLDTSGILAALDSRDPHHREALAVLQRGGPFIIPAGIMAEVTYMIESRLGSDVLDRFLEDLEEAAFLLDCGEDDIQRIRSLIQRYKDLPLGYADASVIACSERNGSHVLTFDFRHFSIVDREGTIRIATVEE